MKHLPLLLALATLATACTKTELETTAPDQRIARTVLYNDIWGTDFADPGQVSDQEPGDSQTRQLPARKTAGIVQTGALLHVATVKSWRYDDAGNLTGYWMEADTALHVTVGGMDTVIKVGSCRFKAGLLSYPSTVGYRQWHKADSDEVPGLDMVRPIAVRKVMGRMCGIYPPGAQLAVRCDLSPDELTIEKVWFEEP